VAGEQTQLAFHMPQKLYPVLALMNFGYRIHGHMYLAIVFFFEGF